MNRKIVILHVIDDQKFISYCKATFQIKDLENLFIKSQELHEDHQLIKIADVLIIHYLQNNLAYFLLNSSLPIPVIWFCWGGDVFDLGIFYNNFVFGKTKRLRVRLAFQNNFAVGIRTLAKTLFPRVFNMDKTTRTIIDAINKVDVVVPVMPGDYQLLKKVFKIKPALFHLNYVNPIFEQENQGIKSNNILVGNSANFTSNHLEAIDRLSKMDLGNRKIIIPLNYGDEFSRNYVCQYAKKKIPNNVECITEFLPFKDYQKVLFTCSIVIMNHLRQQAVGNIVQAILNGANVYLNRSSTVYQFLKEQDFKISEMDELTELRDLNQQEREFNRSKCLEVFGAERQHKKVKELIQLALRKHENRRTQNLTFHKTATKKINEHF